MSSVPILVAITLSYTPLSSEFLPGNKAFLRSFIVVGLAIGLLAFGTGYRKHRKAIVFLPLLAGVWAIGLGDSGFHLWGVSPRHVSPYREVRSLLQPTV